LPSDRRRSPTDRDRTAPSPDRGGGAVPARHVDVLALHGLWLGFGLQAVPLVALAGLGFPAGLPVGAVAYLLGSVVFGGQAAALLSSPRRYEGEYLIPQPLWWAELTSRAIVYLLAGLALGLSALSAVLCVTLLWLQLPG
jgi:hypothetical protein